MAGTTIIVMLALVEYIYFSIAVGRARGKHGVTAPAVTGNEQFERYYRAHQNTLEQLVIFIPAAYAAAYYVHPWYAMIGGTVFVVGRGLYFRAYINEPTSRGPGMLLSMLANVALVIGALVGAVLALL